MKKEGKKWMLVVLALLAVVTVTLPLVGCKNDTVAEQTGDGTGSGSGNQGSGDGNQGTGGETEAGGGTGTGDPEQPVTYTVSFNTNNGTGSIEEQPFTAGVEQELAENAFTRENYTFVGWSEDREATSATYGDKAKFTATKDTTLYAVWNPRWLTFTSDSSTALITKYYVNERLDRNGEVEVPTGMEYSTDGREWSKFTNPQQEIQFGNDTKLYLRGESSRGTATDIDDYVNFTFKDGTKVHASGDIRTLVDWNDPVNAVTSDARFSRLFEYCDELVTAPKLPATTLAKYCYYRMFADCTSLTTAPELPATNLVDYCYESMFSGCTSLETAPKLPATTLATDCYYYMFCGCTKLASVTMLATNVSSESALYNWLDGTADKGTLYVANNDMVNDPTILGEKPSEWKIEVAPTGEQTNQGFALG